MEVAFWSPRAGELAEDGRSAAKDSGRVVETDEWARRELGFEPDALQARVLRCAARRGILNCTRQWGKSTVTAAKALHRAWTKPGSLVLAAGPSARQSGEFLAKVEVFATRLGERLKGDGHNAMSLALGNGSRIVALPGNEATVRGFSAVSLLVIDEAARVKDDLYHALRPMLAVSGGDLWLMSTPYGKQGFFWEEWDHGGAEWERVRAPATECPRIPKWFLDEERGRKTREVFGQEYLCEFHDAGSGVFSRDLVEAAMSDDFGGLDL